MDKVTAFTLIGYVGALCISSAYLIAITGRLEKNPTWFPWLNLFGSIGLCFPSVLAETLVTHVLNGFWIIIALSSLSSYYSKERYRLLNSHMMIIGLGSALIVLGLGASSLSGLTGLSAVILGASLVSLLCFMGGYLYLSTNPEKEKSIPLYLVISLSGNLLYMPILIQDGNWPTFALQTFGFTTGLIKFASLYFSRRPALNAV